MAHIRSFTATGLSNVVILLLTTLHLGLATPVFTMYNGTVHSKAYNMSRYMNTAIHPCYNFYEFACGNFPLVHPASASNQVETSALKMVEAELKARIASALSDNNERNPLYVKAKKFYSSCMNLPNSQLLYKTKLKEIIREFGQMPALAHTWSDSEFDWLETVANISKKYDIQIILGKYVRYVDSFVHGTGNRVHLDLPTFGLDDVDMYRASANGAYLNEYGSTVEQHLIQYLYLQEGYAKRVAREIVSFDVALAIGAANITTCFPTWFTVESLQQKYSINLDIKRYLELALGFAPDGEVVEVCSEYHEHVINVIQRTPKHVVANYIFYSLLRPFMITPVTNFVETVLPQCVALTRTYFGDLVDSMLYDNERVETDKVIKAVENMVYDLKSSVELSLRTNEYYWINGLSLNRLKRNIKGMEIVFKPYVMNNFPQKYGGLVIDAYDFIHNLKAIFIQNGHRTTSLMPSFDKQSLQILPKYNRADNLLEVPMGFVQPALFWSNKYPVSIKLSQFGYFIAQEFVNAMEYLGVPGDGVCSQRARDVGGVHLVHKVFKAWQEIVKRYQVDMRFERLPNMPYDNEQLFFIGFAQLWCNDVNPAYLNLPNGDHAPGRFKVMDALTNYPAFSEVFQCVSAPVGEVCRTY